MTASRRQAKSWRDAVAAIEQSTGSASKLQRDIGVLVGVDVLHKTPRLVAAARLANVLKTELNLPVRGDFVWDSTAKYLEELAGRVGIECSPESELEAEAWIQHVRLISRCRALKELQVDPGDVVEVLEGLNVGRIATVTSVGVNGAIFLAGRGQAWPDQVEVRAKASDLSDKAVELRREADNDAALRTSRRPSANSMRHLERHRTERGVVLADVARLGEVIDRARDETPIQEYLEEHPYLLASLLTHDPRFVIPKPSLGGKYVADFFLADEDSIGIRWILVELQSPRAELALSKSNEFAKQVREGIGQIKEWREWIRSNLAYAVNPPSASGLGFTGLTGESDGLVLVGRRSAVTDRDRILRRQEWVSSRIRIHTYDYLLAALSSIVEYAGLPSMNEYVLQRKPIYSNVADEGFLSEFSDRGIYTEPDISLYDW